MDPDAFIVAFRSSELDLAGEVDAVDDVLKGLCRDGELMLLVIVQRHGNAANDAVAANDRRHGDGQIGQAVLAHHERGDRQNGLLASLNSVAKLPYHWALDGISNTQTINPDALGHSEGERVENLVQVMDGYFDQGAHHLNVNVFGKEKLLDAMEHPEKEEYANFTIRVSGYAVKFIDLTREQQMDVISRTCHAAL